MEPAQPKRINTPRLEHISVPFVNLHCLTILDLFRTESRTDLEESGGCDARGKTRGCFFFTLPSATLTPSLDSVASYLNDLILGQKLREPMPVLPRAHLSHQLERARAWLETKDVDDDIHTPVR